MAQSGIVASPSLPLRYDISVITAQATGTVSVGDWVAYSGQFARATNSGHTAYWKTAGAGIALESNPVYDPAGRAIQNSGLKILKAGVFMASANFSGVPTLGLGAYPDATGSGVAAATGLTGLGATWQTAQVVNNSALSGTANAQQPAVATVIGSTNFANAGTGELVLYLSPLAPDVRG